MTAATHSPLVEKAAEDIADIIDNAIDSGAIRFMGRERTPYLPTDTALALAKQILDACQAEELAAKLRMMTEHYVELAGCGDCGNWNPEEEPEVIEARALLAKLDSPS